MTPQPFSNHSQLGDPNISERFNSNEVDSKPVSKQGDQQLRGFSSRPGLKRFINNSNN